jgi:6-phosphogluconolactonase
MSEVIYDKDRRELEKKAAGIIEDSINRLLKAQDNVVLAVPGGKSVAGVFKELKEKGIQWNKVHIFMADERLVPIDDKDSNFRLAEESFIGELIEKGLLAEGNVHPFILKDKEDYGVGDYEQELKKFGRYDIVLLSSGEDGHIGALYPGHHSVKNDAEYFIFMEDSPKLPLKRMSMSRRLLEKAKVAILLFFGEGKRNAYIGFKDTDIGFKECPAKIVLSVKDLYVLTNVKNQEVDRNERNKRKND